MEERESSSYNMKELFANGRSSMRSNKYRHLASQLQWRQKYIKSKFYELSLLSLRFGEIRLYIEQIDNGEIKGLGTGSFCWPGAHVLSKYLELKYKNDMTNMRVCDIGSGTGCVGLAAASLGAISYLTDQQSILFLLESNKANLIQNFPAIPSENIQIIEYDWGGLPIEDLRNINFDLLLVSDCVLPKLYPIEILVKAVIQLMSNNTKALFSYEHRPFPDYDPRLEFKRIVTKYDLKIEVIPIEEHDLYYCAEDIELWCVTKNSNYS